METRFFAFASYSGSDDDAHFGWIGRFCTVLQTTLRGRLRVQDTVHQYRRNGAASGALPDQMSHAIEQSACMILFVHDGWLQSVECQNELRSFCAAHSAQERRLLIVAMSKAAISDLVASDFWKTTTQIEKPVWIDFFRPDETERPLFFGSASDGEVGKYFDDQFDRLLKEIERCYKLPINKFGRRTHSASQAVQRWAFGAVTSELSDEVKRIAEAASRRNGHDIVLVKSEDLLSGLKLLGEVDTLVLAFNNSEPLLSTSPGGHLRMQADAWLRAGKAADKLLWLDLRHIPAIQRASDEQRMVIHEISKHRRVKPDDLIGGSDLDSQLEQAKIYIESNARELRHWNILGEAIRERWSVVASDETPPLMLIHNALPIDEMNRFEESEISDADGVIVLWGHKKLDSLRDQINRVQRWLPGFRSGKPLPPRLIAYLTPPNEPRSETIPAIYWDVLRFNAESSRLHADHSPEAAATQPASMHWRLSTPEKISVVQDESTLLDNFLRDIVKHAQFRRTQLRVAAS